MGTVKVLKKDTKFYKDLEKVFALMEELDIAIEYSGSEGFVVTNMQSGSQFYLKDSDDGQPTTSIPSLFEFKLQLYEN